MKLCFPSPLYAIADPCDRPERDVAAIARTLLLGGAPMLQLRWKPSPTAALLAAAREIRRLTREHGALFFVNDRVDVAMAAGADGVHLGQEDLPLHAARRLLGDGAVIGISTHDVVQAEVAERDGADYIGFGPIFATTTKVTEYSPRALDALREVRRAVHLPIVAIGGIREDNAAAVLAAGADAVAMIAELVAAPDPTEKVRRVLARIQ